ncbi:hypothetical protein D9M68_433340 [compost metagenome]
MSPGFWGLAWAYAGWVACALAMARHQRQLSARVLPRGLCVALRLAGGLCLLLAFAVAVRHWGWNIGPVAWIAQLSAAALGFVLLFPFRPRLAVLAAPLGLLLVAVVRW